MKYLWLLVALSFFVLLAYVLHDEFIDLFRWLGVTAGELLGDQALFNPER